MHPYHNTKIALLGVGFLLEYLFPCVRHLVGEENLYDCVIGTTAQEDAIPGKEARMGIRVWYKRNDEMLRTLRPDIILFAPQPYLAPEVARTVLKPYYDELRAQSAPLPDLYAAPPSPVGQFYRDLLGQDIHVVNLLPNMLTEISGMDVATQGVTEITFPEGDVWPQDHEARLREFFSPFGACVNTPPHLVMAYLGGQCTLHTVSEYVYTIRTVCNKRGYSLTDAQVASALRAAFQRYTHYHYEPTRPCSEEDVPQALRPAIDQVIRSLYDGVTDACLALGMDRQLIDDLFLNYVDLHLHTLQVETREQVVKTAFQHATKGGVTEMALRVFYQRMEYPLARAFAALEGQIDEKTIVTLREAAADCTRIVTDHGYRLGDPLPPVLGVEHHAVLYGLLVRAFKAHLGDAADQAVHEATVTYGRQRGRRMALRAQKLDLPLNMVSYMALKEWKPSNPTDFDSVSLRQTPYAVSQERLCPWNQAWKTFDMGKEANFYCRDIDQAVLEGFNPVLRLNMPTCLTAGDAQCEFHFLDAQMDADALERLTALKAQLGESAILPFPYHVAHLLAAFTGTALAKYGEKGQAAIDEAIEGFKAQYGQSAWELVDAELKKDFNSID